jgi:hypothetical protein
MGQQMRTLTKILSTTAVAISAAALLSTAANADVYVFATSTYSPTGAPNIPASPGQPAVINQHAIYRDFTWAFNNPVSGPATGTLTGSSVAGPHDATTLEFSQPGFALSGWNIPVDFAFTASETGIAASNSITAGTWTQTGLNGQFHYTYGGTAADTAAIFAATGYSLTAGENILSGFFTDAWIQGAGKSGSANVTFGNGGVLEFTSALGLGFLPTGPNYNNQFAYNLITTAAFGNSGPGGQLTPFAATGNGIFSIPEPGTWALMIMGFGGIGAALRNRRRTTVAFA